MRKEAKAGDVEVVCTRWWHSGWVVFALIVLSLVMGFATALESTSRITSKFVRCMPQDGYTVTVTNAGGVIICSRQTKAIM